MMYSLVNELLRPYALLFLISGVAIVRLWSKPRGSARRLLWLTVPWTLLFLISLPALSYLAFASLEWRYSPLARLPRSSAAMIVLAGGFIPRDRYQKKATLAEDSLFRCLAAADLYRESGPCLILLSGGKVNSAEDAPSLAEMMREFLVTQGVAEADLALEDRSTTTYENAAECDKLLRQRGIRQITLVTDAAHMLRAAGCFEKLGYVVTPAPCRYRAGRFEQRLQNYLPSPGAALGFQAVVHEWLGLAWYWWHGRM